MLIKFAGVLLPPADSGIIWWQSEAGALHRIPFIRASHLPPDLLRTAALNSHQPALEEKPLLEL